MRRLAVLAVVAALVLLGVRAVTGALRDEPEPPSGTRVERFDLESRLLGRRLEQIGVVPARARARPPLLVFLHGRTDDLDGPGSVLGEGFYDGLERLGADAPAVLLVNGGRSSYFHDRRDGPWGRYVLEEAIPAGVRLLGADPRRVAIGGISMGGFGALHLSTRRPFCAVGGHSPALWRSGGETPPGAYDDSADFDRVSAFAHPPRVRPLWLDVGTDDPFRAATEALGDRVGVPVRVPPGGHDGEYWDREWPRYLAFYARALRRCRGG
jgi:S-formylglutathione hydrolase FrmB